MSDSITLNNFLPVQAQDATSTQQKQVTSEAGTLFSELLASHKPKSTVLNQAAYSDHISYIDMAKVKELYMHIRRESKEKMDAENVEHKELKLFDYLNGAIDEIAHTPIEVKIERQELNQAILYNRMGINYLDIKKIEVRIALLQCAKEDVVDKVERKALLESDGKKLIDKVETMQLRLAAQKQNIIDNAKKELSEKLLFELVAKDKPSFQITK